MATALAKQNTVDFSNMAIQVEQLKNDAGSAVDVSDLVNIAGTAGTVVATTVKATSAQHLAINSGTTATDLAGKTVRINSITNTGTADSLIGFQSKPAVGASTANNVIGCEISPRVNDTFALTGSGSIIGAHIDAYLKGTTGNIAGDVRALNIELVTDDAGARDITGNVNGIRMRAAFSAGTVSGAISAIRIEKMETQTGSEQWGYVLDLTDVNGLIWDDDWGTEPSTAAGGFKVRINGQDRWVQTYSSAPS